MSVTNPPKDMNTSKSLALDDILTYMVVNTVMVITNDLPSLLSQEEVYQIRQAHKEEILKNLPAAKQAIVEAVEGLAKNCEKLTWKDFDGTGTEKHYINEDQFLQAIKEWQ